MLDGMDADGEWSDEDGVKSGSATALSDNEPDDRHTTRKTLPTIPGTPTNQKRDPVHAILDKIDAELGAIAAANNITTFSQPVSVKRSSFPSFDRTKLEAQGVVFDDNDKGRTGHTRGGSSDRDTGVGTGSVQDDPGSEHKRIMGTAQIHSDVADLTDVQTDDGRKLDEGHSDLDSVAAQQIDEKFKEIMRKKRGGYLDDLRARIPRPESDRGTVNSEEGVATRVPDPPHRTRRSRSSGPQGKPPRPSPPRSCLTPPASPSRGPADLPSYQRQTFLSPPVPKQSQHTSQPYTGYASDLDSVKTEDFESRFQDLIIGQQLKDSSSRLKPVSNKLSKADSNSQVQSEMNNNNRMYSKPPRTKPEPKSFLSSRIFSNFQSKPSNDSSLRMSSLSPPRPSSESTSTGTKDILLPRPRSVSPARLRQWSETHRQRNAGLFSWDDDFWRTKPSPRRSGSASTFEEVESLCLSKSSSSVESQHPRIHPRSLSRSFTRESSTTSNSTSTGASSCQDSSGNRSQSISSLGSALEDGESFELPNQLSDSTYMERIFQRVLDWRTGEQSNGAWKCENWNNSQGRPGSSGVPELGGQKKGRKKVLIIPDEEEEGIPFAKMKFNHKPDFKSEQGLKSLKKGKLVRQQSSQSEESLSGRQLKQPFLPSQMSLSSHSTDLSSWQESTSNQTNGSFDKVSHSPVCSRAISVDNLNSLPPAPPKEFYAPYNPYLPVHAERMLMNLGFGGADSLLPERFLKDWYQKMQKAQLESQHLNNLPDGQESAAENISISHDPSARSTPNTGLMYPEAMIPFRSQRFLQRSATVSSYHPVTEEPTRKEHKTTEFSHTSRTSGPHVMSRRRQWANSRQKSLPLFLETLNEEDESRSRTTSSDEFSKLKAFLADELMSFKSSDSSPDNSHTDSECDSHSHTAENSQHVAIEQKAVISSQVAEQENSITNIPLNKHILTPSKDSLEVADIMQNTKTKKHTLLEPAMVSIVLEDVDGNVISNSSQPTKEDYLSIPSSQGSFPMSPIPLSPVTVIEVSLDNQQDSVDTDDGPSNSKEMDILNTSDNGKPKSKLSENNSKTYSSPHKTLQRHVRVDNECSVEADDGTLSPINKFPPLGEFLAWLEESRDCEYYIAHDQSIQCEAEYLIEHQDTVCVDGHHVSQTHAKMIDKEVQISVSKVSKQSQTEEDDSLEYENEMYQKVLSNHATSKDCPDPTQLDDSVGIPSTVHTISPLCFNEDSCTSDSERHCLTDDWVTSNFRSQREKQHSSAKLSRLKNSPKHLVIDETDYKVHGTTDSRELPSQSVEKTSNSLVKLNEDGSPMTKLDIFATQFLAEAEEMCSRMNSRAKEELRRDSVISSTLSDDSLGTVILNTKLKQKTSFSEDYLQQKESFSTDADPFQSHSSVEDESSSVTTSSPSETSTSLYGPLRGRNSNTSTLALPLNLRNSDTSSRSNGLYKGSQSKMKKGTCGYKSESMDLISGHVPLRRTHALSLPLDCMHAGSWSMFSTSVSSDSTDAESLQGMSNSMIVDGKAYQMNLNSRKQHLSVPAPFEDLEEQEESTAQNWFQDNSTALSLFSSDASTKRQLLKPSLRVDENDTGEYFDKKSVSSVNNTSFVEEIVHPENEQVELFPDNIEDQEKHDGCEARPSDKDGQEEEENAKKNCFVKLLPNVFTQKIIESSVSGTQRTEKPTFGVVNQMTTIYESDSDISDYEHYRKEKKKTNSQYEFTKSRSWNGSRRQNRLPSKLNVKSYSLNMNDKTRGHFGRLARKAFIKTKTVRVQSPPNGSDQETSEEHSNKDLSTVKTVSTNQLNCQTTSNNESNDISQSHEEDNVRVERCTTSAQDTGGSPGHKADRSLHHDKKSNTISLTLKRMFLTPSQVAEKTLTQPNVPSCQVTPYLNNSNSFKPIQSDDTLSSCSESSFESNYFPTTIKQASFLQVPLSSTPDHNVLDSTDLRVRTYEPVYLSPSSQGSSADTSSSEMADVSHGTPMSSPQSLISPTSKEVLNLQKDSVFRSLSPSDRKRLSQPIYATPVAKKGVRSPETERMLLYGEEGYSKNTKGSSPKLSPVQSPIIGSKRLSSPGSPSAFKECHASKRTSPMTSQSDSMSCSTPIVPHHESLSRERLNHLSQSESTEKNLKITLHQSHNPYEVSKWTSSLLPDRLPSEVSEEQLHSISLEQKHLREEQSDSRILEQRHQTEEQLGSRFHDQRHQSEEPSHSSFLEQRYVTENLLHSRSPDTTEAQLDSRFQDQRHVTENLLHSRSQDKTEQQLDSRFQDQSHVTENLLHSRSPDATEQQLNSRFQDQRHVTENLLNSISPDTSEAQLDSRFQDQSHVTETLLHSRSPDTTEAQLDSRFQDQSHVTETLLHSRSPDTTEAQLDSRFQNQRHVTENLLHSRSPDTSEAQLDSRFLEQRYVTENLLHSKSPDTTQAQLDSRFQDQRHVTETLLHSRSPDATEQQLDSRFLGQRLSPEEHCQVTEELQAKHQEVQETKDQSLRVMNHKSYVDLHGQTVTPDTSMGVININSCVNSQSSLTDNMFPACHESLSRFASSPVLNSVNIRIRSMERKCVSKDFQTSKDEGFCSKELLEEIEDTEKQSNDTNWKDYSRSRPQKQPKISVSAIKSKFELGYEAQKKIPNSLHSKKVVHQNVRDMINKYENS